MYNKDYTSSAWHGFSAGMTTWGLYNPKVAAIWTTFKFGNLIGDFINNIDIGGKRVEDIIFDNITDPLISLPGKIKNTHESIKNDVCTAAQGWSNIFERNAARKKNGNDDSAWLLCKYAGVCNY